METNLILCRYEFVLAMPFKRIRSCALAYDHRLLAGQPGIDLITRQRGYPAQALKSPADHVAELEATRRIQATSGLLCLTARNAFQNPRSPVWSLEYGLCENQADKAALSQRPYYGIGLRKDGTAAAEKVDFKTKGQPGGDFTEWFAGVPALWDGKIMSVTEMLPEVGDFCHLFRFKSDPSHQLSPKGEVAYRRLAAIYERTRLATAGKAGAALMTATRGLARERNYLHHCLGVSKTGFVVVLAHGTPEQVGRLAQKAGATHAIITENGGSPQISQRKPGGVLRPIVESFYWREPTIAALVFEIACDRDSSHLLIYSSRQPTLPN